MKTCSFFGHRNTESTPTLCENLKNVVVRLIKEQKVKKFLFGSKSKFNSLCLDIVTEIKVEYPDIKLVYVRSAFPYISDSYRDYLLESYDDTLIPERVINAGRASYVERNQEMIDASDFCIFYYDENYKPPLRKEYKGALTLRQPKSGTARAYEYAKRKEKEIINLYE